MATRRFCDLCDQPLTPEDDQPLVRALSYTPISATGQRNYSAEGPPKLQAVAYVEITNENNKPLTDVCIGCKLHIVSDGLPTTQPKPSPIATLQPKVPADTQSEIRPFAAPVVQPSKLLSETPPKLQPEPPTIFEPSLPGDRPNPRMG